MTETPSPRAGANGGQPSKRRFNLATMALTVGVCAFILGFVPWLFMVTPGVALTAIIVGTISLFRKDGRKVAAGVGIAFGLAACVLGVKVLAWSVEAGKKSTCETELHSIGQVVQVYTSRHEGVPPPDLHTLIQAKLVPRYGLRCASVRHSDRASDYFYMPPGKDAVGETIIGCDFKGNHRDGRNVLWDHAGVTWMCRKEFAAEMAKPRNAAFAKALREAEKAQP